MNIRIENVKQYPQYIWLDGDFIPWDDARVHLLTHSLHYAGMVWEGIKSYHHKPFKLLEHCVRLIESAKMLRMSVPYSPEQICDIVLETLQKNELQHAYIRPMIWRDTDSLKLFHQKFDVHIAVMCLKSHLLQARLDRSLYLSTWRKAPPEVMHPQCKSAAHYEVMLVAQMEAAEQGCDDALFLDMNGYIAECTTSNIFFICNGELITPIADSFLNGITRQSVIEIARAMNMSVRQERITLEAIESCEECFVTGTASEIQGVKSINIGVKKLAFPSSVIVKQLQERYAQITGKIQGQIC